MTSEQLEYVEPNFESIKRKLISNSKSKQLRRTKIDQNLLSSFSFGDLTFKNHLSFINLNDDMFYADKMPNDLFYDFYMKIAKSGVGMIITGPTYNKLKCDTMFTASSIDVKSQKAIERHTSLVTDVHSLGVKIFLQIRSIFGRGDSQNKSLNIFNYSASFNSSYENAYIPCRRLPDSMCQEIAEHFGELASFSKMAGYDGILINGESTNILGEFSSSEFNRRVFGYYVKPNEFVSKILSEINLVCDRLPILFSITVNTFLKNIFKNEIKNIKSLRKIGLKSSFKSICEYLTELVNMGVDGFVFRFGTYETEYFSVYNEFQSEDLFYEYYVEIKNYFDSINLKNKFGDKVSVIYTDNFSNFEIVNNYHQSGLLDFVDITRHLYSDVNYIYKLQNKIDYNPCIKCGYCNNLARQNIIGCLINPNLLVKEINEKLQTKTVAIVGAGISGIMCSNFLAKFGFCVDLYEKNNILNKMGKICEIFEYDKFLHKFNNYVENTLNANIDNGKIKLYLGQEFTSNIARKYDSVIISTGFHEHLLNLNGSVLKNVKSIYDVLSNEKIFENLTKITIFASSELSIKLALYLLKKEKKVSIIFPNFEKLKNIPNDKFAYYFYELAELKAKIYIDAKVKKINQDFVEIIVNNNLIKNNPLTTIMNLKSNIKYKYEPKLIACDLDLFIYEPELYSNNKLFYELVNVGFMGELYMIGDALHICDLAENIKSAYFVAKNL